MEQSPRVIPSLVLIAADSVVRSLGECGAGIAALPIVSDELYTLLDQRYQKQTKITLLHYYVLMYPNPVSLPAIKNLCLYYRSMDINAPDYLQETPLHKAALWGFSKIAKLLIFHGADVTIKNIFGDTPLHRAALRGYPQELNIALVNNPSPAPSCYNFFINNPLPNLFTRTPNKMPKRGTKRDYEKIITLLLENDADAMTPGRYGNLPLHNAADQGFYKGLVALVKHSPEGIGAKNNYQKTALHKVVRKGKSPCIELLLQHGARDDAVDLQQLTPLDCAQHYNNEQAVQILKRIKAHACDKNNDPLHA